MLACCRYDYIHSHEVGVEWGEKWGRVRRGERGRQGGWWVFRTVRYGCCFRVTLTLFVMVLVAVVSIGLRAI